MKKYSVLIILILLFTITFAEAQSRTPKYLGGTSIGGFEYSRHKTTFEILKVNAPVKWWDDFIEKQTAVNGTDTLNMFYKMNSDSGTAVITTMSNGYIEFTTSSDDDDDIELSSLDSTWVVGKKIAFDVRLRNQDVSGLSWNVGFCNVDSAFSNDSIAVGLNADGAQYIPSNVTEFCGFVYDPDTLDVIYGANVKAASSDSSTLVSTSGTVTPTDSVYVRLRVEMDVDERAWFFVDGVPVGSTATAMTVNRHTFFYMACINREGSANVLRFDYARIWSGR